jgi:hypothetical protein
MAKVRPSPGSHLPGEGLFIAYVILRKALNARKDKPA